MADGTFTFEDATAAPDTFTWDDVAGDYAYLPPLPPITAEQLGEEHETHPALPLPPRRPSLTLPPSAPDPGAPSSDETTPYLAPLPPISDAQLAPDPRPWMQRPAVTVLADDEAFGGVPRIPVLGAEGTRLRGATEFARGLQESLAGGVESMTTPEAMVTYPLFAMPYVGPALAAGLGTKTTAAGMGELLTGAELHDPALAASGFGQVLLGSPLLARAGLPEPLRGVRKPVLPPYEGLEGDLARAKNITPAPRQLTEGAPSVPEPSPEPLAPTVLESRPRPRPPAPRGLAPAPVPPAPVPPAAAPTAPYPNEGVGSPADKFGAIYGPILTPAMQERFKHQVGESFDLPSAEGTTTTLKVRPNTLWLEVNRRVPGPVNEYEVAVATMHIRANGETILNATTHGRDIDKQAAQALLDFLGKTQGEKAATPTLTPTLSPAEQPAAPTVEVPAKLTPAEAAAAKAVGLTIVEPPSTQPVIDVAEVPAAQPVTSPAPAAAKAQAEVSRVAATEGKRSAKEIKDELVARLEQVVKDAPEGDVSALPEEQRKLTIEIPGDGTFTVVNNKASLAGLLKRAKAIDTNATKGQPSAFTKTKLKSVPKAKDALTALRRFVSTDEARYILQAAWSDGERIIASDRRVLLAVEGNFGGTPDAPVSIVPKTGKPLDLEDVQAPKYLAVLPDDTQFKQVAEVDVADLHRAVQQILPLFKGEREWPWVDLRVSATGDVGLSGIVKSEEQGGEAFIGKQDAPVIGRYRADQLRELANAAGELGAKRVRLGVSENPQSAGALVLKGDKWTMLATKASAEEPPTPAESTTEPPAESRIAPSAAPADIFDLPDEDLRDLLDEAFPPPPKGSAAAPAYRRPGTFEFDDYDQFRDWMDKRYAERDIEGMKLAFAEAPTANKIAYIKGNKGVPHKSDWIRHLATGAVLPVEDPPVPRTTPRPLPGGGMQPPTGGTPPPPSHASPAPPPPRQPSVHPKFDITALVQLYRQFGKFPVMNERLRRAYGRLLPDAQLIELKSRLLWDTALAERVLGHEIGHFIDLIVPLIGKGKQFGQRLRLLTDFTGRVWQATELRNDARSLSRQWRGPFVNGDKYRDSARELIADFLSAMLHDPEWVNQNYPRLYDAFSEFRTAKPDFDTAYREIETWLQGGRVVNELLAQDKAAVQRTFDILAAEEPKRPLAARAKLLVDRVNQALVSLWGRAFEKEGKPRRIGESVTEKLETSYMWAAKQTALWSDNYTKLVQPHLDRVADDPIEAHADLLAYTKAVRTIGERRAAGQWIEAHPAEARELLQGILDLDDALRSKFQPALDSATDPALYDLSAVIFREIHDRGDAFVSRIAKEIDDLNLGVGGDAVLVAFNVRGKLLNPGGQSVPNSHRMIAHLRDRLGPSRFAELEAAARALRGLLAGVQREMFDAGLISQSAWDNLIAPNTDNYVPYAVLDYFDGRVKAGIMPQKGTAKDVADVGAATQLKVASAYAWLQAQRQVQLLRDIYSMTGPQPLGPELRRASDINGVRTRVRNADDDVSRAVLWVDGKPHLVEFPGDPGKQLEKALRLPEFYQHVEWLHATSKITHSLMQFYTALSPRFLLYRNVVRGFRTAGLKVGYGTAAQQMTRANLKRNIALARNYADAAFGAPMLPEVRRMVDLEALPPPRIALGAVRDLPNMRELLVRGALPVFAARYLKPSTPTTRSALSAKASAAKNEIDKAFTAYEAFEKIYNYMAAQSLGLSEQTASAIAQRGGIPRPGVSGKWSNVAEIIWPWTRVKIQGMRSTVQMLRDPRFGKGFGARFAIFEALPRIAKVLVGIGLASAAINWIMRKDEDENDPVWGEVMRRVSPYKMALDDVVPFAFYDSRTGQYHPFWEFKRGKDVPKHYEVVSLRIPASEEGQTFGSALYMALTSLPGAQEKLGRPGKGVLETLGAIRDAVGPELSPLLQTSGELRRMIFDGKNPDDPRTGSPSANPQLFDAGGSDRAQAIAGFVMNNAGGPGEAAAILAANLGLLDERALGALSHRLASDKRPWSERMPFLTTAVSHDNYGQYREEKTAALADEQTRARARLVMPPEVRTLYDFYYRNLDRQEKLDPSDRVRFAVAEIFVQDVWGSAKDEGRTFYNAAMHATGKEGSKAARETVKRDLLTATEALRAAWDSANVPAKP